jgi:hypothetical protein
VSDKRWNIVEQAKVPPQRCVVYPQYSGVHDEGFFDTTNRIGGVDPYAYVSVVAVKHMAAQLGWVSPESVEDKERRIRELEMVIKTQDEELKSADKQLEAINTLRSERWRPVSKPGPKKGSGGRPKIAVEDDQ